MIGNTINNYIIERKLGEGGMGNVYLGRHNRVDRLVAIKVLHQTLFTNENIRNRFKNEANALIKLWHPNIVKIYDYVEQDNFACLVMEYIEGYTLDDYITKVSGPLVTEKAIHIICNILDAVQYAHDNNILHRDIKPGNIMVSKDGRVVRIMDFGIAKIVDAENFKATKANAQLGTPFYMSPEQVKGMPYTGLSDIYSLGVTLFEMVTGKCPYQTITNLFELQSKIVNEPLPPTSIYYPEVSLIIQASIKKATEKDPALRFHSCKEFKKYLQKDKVEPLLPSIPVAYELKSRKTVLLSAETIKTTTANGDKSVEKKISYPNLLEAYPPKEKQKKTWVYGLALFFLFFISGLIYFLNKNTGNAKDPGEGSVVNNPIPETSDSSDRIKDSNMTQIAIIGEKNESGVVIDTNTTGNNTFQKNQNDESNKTPTQMFQYLNKAQVRNDVIQQKLKCGGDLFTGRSGQKMEYEIPPKEFQINNTSIPLSIYLIDKETNRTCEYLLKYEKKGNVYMLISKPIGN